MKEPFVIVDHEKILFRQFIMDLSRSYIKEALAEMDIVDDRMVYNIVNALQEPFALNWDIAFKTAQFSVYGTDN